MAPPLLTGAHDDHVLSGVAVLPVRVSTTRVVPAGKLAVQLTAPQVTTLPALKTIDRYVPLVAPEASVSSPPDVLVTVVLLWVPELKSATVVCCQVPATNGLTKPLMPALVFVVGDMAPAAAMPY